jgi:protein-S-isoprenylcysteine O-methyltransferase Ste14
VSTVRDEARHGSLETRPDSAPAGGLETAIWVLAVLFTLLGLLVALALLWQRGAPDPWARVNVYTGGVLLVGSVAGIAQAVTFLRSALRSLGVAGEALGLSYDPGVLLFGLVTEPAKFAVLLDYSRWHLVPSLEQPALQALGLAVTVIGSAGLIWTDRCLARHFASDEAATELMTRGPYRFVRHPRYLSILLLTLGFALAFASIVGWALVFIVLAAVLHRIAREEVHLRDVFGAAYEAYARRTARLVPLLF